MITFEEQKEDSLNIMNRASESWGEHLEVQQKCNWNSRREGESGGKNIWRNNGWKLPNFSEKHEFANLKNAVNTSRINTKTPTPS